MKNKKKGPKKGAAKKWSERLREVGNQSPPKDLIDVINNYPQATNEEIDEFLRKNHELIDDLVD